MFAAFDNTPVIVMHLLDLKETDKELGEEAYEKLTKAFAGYTVWDTDEETTDAHDD